MVDITTGSLRDASFSGYGWPNTAYASSFFAYVLAFNDGYILSSSNANRWGGFMVQPSQPAIPGVLTLFDKKKSTRAKLFGGGVSEYKNAEPDS